VLTSNVYDKGKLDRLIREPQNTISNFPYMFAGLVIILSGRKVLSFSLGLAGIFLGFGSGMYHATLLPEWRMIDILGVYAVLFSLILMGLGANLSWIKGALFGFVAVILTWSLAIYTGIHRNDVRWLGVKLFDSTYVFVAAVGLGCVLVLLSMRLVRNRAKFFKAVTIFLISTPISFAGGIGDRFGGFWANPEALVQGHAVWHVFGAISMLALYELFSAVGFDRSIAGAEIRLTAGEVGN
jgi:hypothetical protein